MKNVPFVLVGALAIAAGIYWQQRAHSDDPRAASGVVDYEPRLAALEQRVTALEQTADSALEPADISGEICTDCNALASSAKPRSGASTGWRPLARWRGRR